MAFITDRKRATGRGAAGSGTEHFWTHLVSSILLQVLIPVFVITFALGLDGSYEDVVAYFGRPFPAIVTGLTLVVGILHLLREVQEAVEDYVHGLAEKLTLIAVQAFAYTMIVVGIYALIRLAI